MKPLIFLIIFFSFSPSTFTQSIEKKYSVKKFNLGISSGVGGMHFLGHPVLEAKAYNFSFRLTYGFYFWGYGVDYEFGQIRFRSLNSLYSKWIISYSNSIQHSAICFDRCETVDYNNIYRLMGGVKMYGSPRISFLIKAGAAMNLYKKYYREEYLPVSEKDFGTGTKVFPFGEISAILLFFKN